MSTTAHLNHQQIARVEALNAAAPLVRKTGDPGDLVDLAEYIIAGTHPMDRYSGEKR